METTLYNHKNTSQDGKPLIPNAVYKALLHLKSVNDIEACEYIIKNYSLTSFQLNLYETSN